MIALLTATWDEITLLNKNIQVSEQGGNADLEFVLGDLFNLPIVAAQTGVGIRRARAGASLIIQKFKPALIILAGFGGALSSNIQVGDIILGESVTSLKKKETCKLYSDFPVSNTEFIKGQILTESRFINEPDQKKKLLEASNALVVDMETWGVIEAASQSKTPVASVRAVSDLSTDKLPDMGLLYGANGELDFIKADKYFKENPELMTPYLKFRFRNTPIASDSLSNFLSGLIAGL